ncbi:MarR family transcriptional regulator [Haloarculaceae archaeon H-GB2-1]|nr:MarR family transcriptional regulator [Haloarculaceae archaeon H-GB1-1]MEA5386935.1 MarR family transcriptional regulator [Haloarculaceae archaeon H-GB11]MEA5408441.1 MarR family transcriptional regulator [Haloarculaceae archaeon H-GB2-1]
MVERVEWLSPIDYEILEFYEECDIKASAKVVSANIDYSRNYTNRRFRALSKAGLLRKDEDSGLYELSDDARKFLKGEVDEEAFKQVE